MRKIFSTTSFILGIIFFILFMVAACAAYYMTAGVFITSRLAVLYAALGLLGALGIVFRCYLFSGFFYAGCVLGWIAGHFVGTLKGGFAPTAGVITTFFLIAVFALVGFLLEVKHKRRLRRKRLAQQEKEAQTEEPVPPAASDPVPIPAPEEPVPHVSAAEGAEVPAPEEVASAAGPEESVAPAESDAPPSL